MSLANEARIGATLSLPSSEQPWSRQQPLWHIPVLSVTTCFAYPLYWAYKTWRDLHAAALEDQGDTRLDKYRNISPLLRALSVLAPSVLALFPGMPLVLLAICQTIGMYFGLTLIKGCAELNPDQRAFCVRRPLLATLLLAACLLALAKLSSLPGAFYLLSLSACLPFVLVQSWLNRFWQAREGGALAVRQTFTLKEIGAIVIGGFVLGAIVMSFLIDR